MPEPTVKREKAERAESLPVTFNGLQIGRASNAEKAIQIVEKCVVVFTGSETVSPLVRRQIAWAKLAKMFGYEELQEDVLQDASDASGFHYSISHAAA